MAQLTSRDIPYRLNKEQKDFLARQYASLDSDYTVIEKTKYGEKRIRKKMLEFETKFWKKFSLVNDITELKVLRKYSVDSDISLFAILIEYKSFSYTDYSYTALYLWRSGDRVVRLDHINNQKTDFEKHLIYLSHQLHEYHYNKLIISRDSEC
ncbi:MAG: hypothetical protein GOU99_01150 [Candidatus Altiarchaeota archaeon]|nr:hypothetical protein [Candidatus Altiarchaeota archaeon]